MHGNYFERSHKSIKRLQACLLLVKRKSDSVSFYKTNSFKEILFEYFIEVEIIIFFSIILFISVSKN